MSRSSSIRFAAVILLAVSALMTHRVLGSFQQDSATGPRYATVDLLSLLEDMLQMDEYKPARDAFRDEWTARITEVQTRIQQVETELRMSAPTDPNVRTLQQQYQQMGYEFNQLRNEASLGFDQFNAEQAAEAYQKLHTEANSLAMALGYTHLFVSRESSEITERGNLATVTQEILARPLALAPESDTLTGRLRERLAIPVPPTEPETEEATETQGTDEDGSTEAESE